MAEKKTEKKDPGIAALVATAGMLILGAPAIGYVYLEQVKKGLIYIILNWLVVGILAGIYIFGGMLTGIGFICLLPIFLLALVFECAVVYDVYLNAKGGKPILPSF